MLNWTKTDITTTATATTTITTNNNNNDDNNYHHFYIVLSVSSYSQFKCLALFLPFRGF